MHGEKEAIELVKTYHNKLKDFVEESSIQKLAAECAYIDAKNTLDQIDKHDYNKIFIYKQIVKILNRL